MRQAIRKFALDRGIAITDLFSVWAQLLASLLNIRSIFAENIPVADGLKHFTLKLLSSATEEIGWEYRPEEDYLTGQLRALLIGTAGGARHAAYDLLLTKPEERD